MHSVGVGAIVGVGEGVGIMVTVAVDAVEAVVARVSIGSNIPRTQSVKLIATIRIAIIKLKQGSSLLFFSY